MLTGSLRYINSSNQAVIDACDFLGMDAYREFPCFLEVCAGRDDHFLSCTLFCKYQVL